MSKERIQDKLGRLDSYSLDFGKYTLLLRPDRSAPGRAVFFYGIRGPGLPNLNITREGAVPVEEAEVEMLPEGIGVIQFHDPQGPLRISLVRDA